MTGPIVGVGDPTIPANAIEGVLDCPTVDLPEYTFARNVAAPLSDAFGRACATCHGAAGEGSTLYPSLPGALSFDEFRAVVRSGRNEGMAAFPEGSISDAQLENDYEVLTSVRAMGTEATYLGGEWTWSEAQVEQAHREGLIAWRKPDSHGVACANCHTPDAFDLAILGYPDDAILRRARLHLGPNDSANVVNLVHAQRRRFNIGRPCSVDYRPFQPGGDVLPGATPAEQDLSFANELVSREFDVMVGRVETLEDARQAFQELADTDLRRLPIGIALPRWTEDGFNGDDHHSLNDYISPLGRVPNDPEQWYALSDRYVADPSDDNFMELYTRFMESTNDQGFAERHQARLQDCGHYQRAHQWLTNLNDIKRQSALVVQHHLRRVALGLEDFYARPSVPFVDRPEFTSPFMRIGSRNLEPICYQRSGPVRAIFATLPEDVREEVDERDLSAGVLVDTPLELSHPWFSLAQVYDQSLFRTAEPTQQGNALHYWNTINFAQREVHAPFFNAHRIATQAAYYDTHQGIPPGSWSGANPEVHPLLDGGSMHHEHLHHVVAAEDPRATVANRLKGNLIRMFLLLQRSLLQQGERVTGVESRSPDPHHGHSLTEDLEHWRRYVDHLRDENIAGLSDNPLYTTDLLSLASEVEELIARAPR
ncbi:MAG: cytochrome c [Myxococcota bacterium]